MSTVLEDVVGSAERERQAVSREGEEMSWGDNIDKVQQEAMVNYLAEALVPTPPPLVITREMRHAIVGEIQQHVLNHLPMQYAWIVNMTLLDYGCRALVAEPDED
jgi:hypothetical protein